MTRYDTILSLGDEFMHLVRQKLIPVHVPHWKVYYEAWLKEKEMSLNSANRISKTQAASNVAGHFDITERTLYNVIAFMEGE